MIAKDVKAGARLVDDNGNTVYVVQEVAIVSARMEVMARIEYADGGPGVRLWGLTDEVPLTQD